MTTYDVYLGELGPGGELDWGGVPGIGNIPKRVGPFFPAGRVRPHDVVVDWIARGVFDGKRVDWGSHAARVMPKDLRYFVEVCYGGHVPPDLAAFLATLDPERSYALIACEM